MYNSRFTVSVLFSVYFSSAKNKHDALGVIWSNIKQHVCLPFGSRLCFTGGGWNDRQRVFAHKKKQKKCLQLLWMLLVHPDHAESLCETESRANFTMSRNGCTPRVLLHKSEHTQYEQHTYTADYCSWNQKRLVGKFGHISMVMCAACVYTLN